MELHKTKKIKYFTKELLELKYQGFSEEEVIICANSTAALEKMVVWHKELTSYREVDAVYIEFNTGHHYMVGRWEVGDIGVQVGVTNGLAKVKRIKILGKFQTKKCQIL